jgi:NADPH-dependent curcumin reductase CurA
MRNWLNAARSYMRPIDIGEPMRAAGIGRVVDSKSKNIAVGDLVRDSLYTFPMQRNGADGQVYGTLNWQEYWIGGDDKIERRE